VILGEQTMTITELAVRLGLRVSEQDDTFVALKNSANTVLIFTYTDGRFFVNGKPIGPAGKIDRTGNQIRVANTLVGEIQPHLRTEAVQRPPTVTRRGHVVIDPGHGGRDPGAISVTGGYEKNVNLQVALKVAALLRQAGIRVTMTRSDDRYPELESRADVANRNGADLFVSIHADSAPDSSAQGSTLYVAEAASAGALRAARAIGEAMTAAGVDGRGIRRNDYRVLVRTRCPAVLIELGYLSNYAEATRLQNTAYQDRLATAIASGITRYMR
jgi:N-acetylmuramoyl-L-alanine amidase